MSLINFFVLFELNDELPESIGLIEKRVKLPFKVFLGSLIIFFEVVIFELSFIDLVFEVIFLQLFWLVEIDIFSVELFNRFVFVLASVLELVIFLVLVLKLIFDELFLNDQGVDELSFLKEDFAELLFVRVVVQL